jgi:Carboxypeptidase regulatory-like domain
MKKLWLFGLALLLLGLGPALYAQTVSGNIAVTIQDKSGAAIPKASVTAVNTATGFTKNGTANEQGELLFTDLPAGSYTITVTAAGFAKSEKTNFPVQLNRTNSATFTLEVQTQSVTVEVTGAPPPINTTTAQIEGTFEAHETADLPTAGLNNGSGVINLALLEPGVGTSGGIGYGTGPSVGGQRPTNNNFTVEGVDNNSKSVTGPLLFVPNDAVAEFSTLQNDYSPEFGHSNGGQFNTTIKSGTNTFHGLAYEYALNRYLDATDQQTIVGKVQPQRPRYDNNRFGGDLGGPIIKDKLFFFALGEYNPVGAAAFTAGGICTPTAAGYTALAALPAGPNPNGVAGSMVSASANNLTLFKNYVAASPTGTSGSCPSTQKYPDYTVGGTTITNPDYVCTGGSLPSITLKSMSNPTGSVSCPNGATPIGIDVGTLSVTGPNFTNFTNLVFGGDYNLSSRDQFRIRYIYNKIASIDTAAEFPAFYTSTPTKDHLVALNYYHTFRPDLTNEFRLGFNRYANILPAGNFNVAPLKLDQFPNIQLIDINVQLGPDGNAPQFGIQNTYQASENLNWSHKNHNVRVGVDVRRYIAPTGFTQRARGDYDYTSISPYFYDINPDFLAERSTGSLTYYGDLIDTGWYISDVWRIRPSVSIDYGIRYEYATIPFGERLQALNSASSVPGVMTWAEPRAPKNQFMPWAGFAWSPDTNRTWSIRGGIRMGYDVLYDNLGLNSISAGAVPQLGATIDRPQSAGIINNFLANGAIPPGSGGFNTFPACLPPMAACNNIFAPYNTSLALQQAFTAGQVPQNINNPVAVSWNLGVQHVFAKNYTFEIRYLGTHGYHLPTQIQSNKMPAQTPTNFLPTFLTAPSAATLAGLTTTRASLTAYPLAEYVPAFVTGCSPAPTADPNVDGLLADGLTPAPCFVSTITSFQSNGNSIYHGLATQLTRRFEHGLQFNLSYTFSHAIDDSTASLFSTVLTPRRAQNGLDLANDRSNSALDHRHRITMEVYYDLPYFKSGNWFRRNVMGNWFFTPVYTFQSGGWATIHASQDTNLNGDSAGDRVLFNSAGIGNTGTGASAACLVGGVVMTTGCTSANTVAYVANNSTARYIRTGAGGLEPNNGLTVLGRNTLQLRPINDVDLTLGKKFSVTERVHLEFQAQFFNMFNHPQYIAGSLDDVRAIGYTGAAQSNYLNPASGAFNQPEVTFSSNPRVIQLAAKLVF